MAFYPQITDSAITQFQVVFANLAADKTYLDQPECNYSEAVKRFFRDHSGVGGPVGGNSIFDGEDRTDAIEDQIGVLIKDLDNLAGQLKTSDHSERLQYFKTKASLIEKLVSMRERIFNVREMSEFQSLVMTFLEELCTKDQISQLMMRLGHLPTIQEKSPS